MQRLRKLLLLPTLFIFAGLVSGFAEIIDRIVAVVNRQIITLSDVEQEKKFQELGINEEEEIQSQLSKGKQIQFELIQKLIEQNLMRQQIQQFPGIEVSSEEIERQITAIRERYGSADRWENSLKSLHIRLEDLRARVEWQLQVLKFLDYRFRQFIVVDQKEIEDYYNKNLLPELARKGIKDSPPLTQVEQKIREIVTEEKLTVQIDDWLKSLKESASIEIFN